MALTTAPLPARTPAALTDLGPIAQLRAGRLGRRVPQLLVGLVLYGVSLAMLFRSGTGLAPWDVLHSGFIQHVPITIGQAVILFSFVVLALWVPLRERPGVGTFANAILLGLSADATLALTSDPTGILARGATMVGGILLCALATALYVGAQLGRGPRDGLMTGLHRRTGLSIRLVRTGLEVGVVLIGVLLGGAVGVGTVAFALTIGPLTQWMLPWCVVDLPEATPELSRARP
ncbi:hypothetical protein E8D34_06835 [Nocardioides sp. GY 10113]|nr:hypothetical protein E8D34_06835 [Nocardioides sp. GY 10113]